MRSQGGLVVQKCSVQLNKIDPTRFSLHHICAKVTLKIATLTFSLLAGSAAYIEPPGPTPDTLESVRKLYFAAHDGDGDAAKQCSTLLSDLLKRFPHDPLVLAYHGSLKLRESQTTVAVWRKGRLAKEGLQALDRAVRLSPEHLEVRFIRGATTFHLPGFFKREEQTRSDFAWLSTRVERGVKEGRVQPRFASAALYYHGVLLEKEAQTEDSKAAWQAALRVGPGTNGAVQAAKKLK
jgi:hypothetical protein